MHNAKWPPECGCSTLDRSQCTRSTKITQLDRCQWEHLNAPHNLRFEAGSVRINSPSIVEVDAIRAIADGVEIFRAGKLVFLTEEIPPQYLYKVSNDDPELLEVLENLEEE